MRPCMDRLTTSGFADADSVGVLASFGRPAKSWSLRSLFDNWDVVGPTSDELFERRYRAKFKELLADSGLTIEYEIDRAALDIGFHPLDQSSRGLTRALTTTRIWFQLKGKRETTLSMEQLTAQPEVACGGISKDQVRYWYAASEPVYLVVYLEALDVFIGEDVRDIIDRQWGKAALRPDFLAGPETVTLHVRTAHVIADDWIASLRDH